MAKDGKSEITFMRGARSFIQGRFETVERETFDDGWTPEEKDARPLETHARLERARWLAADDGSVDVCVVRSIVRYLGAGDCVVFCCSGASHASRSFLLGL